MRFGTQTGTMGNQAAKNRDQINTQEETGQYPIASVIGMAAIGHWMSPLLLPLPSLEGF